jgi:hypothetical protein
MSMDHETTKKQIEELDRRIKIVPSYDGEITLSKSVRDLAQAKLALVKAYAIQVEVAALEPGCGCDDE